MKSKFIIKKRYSDFEKLRNLLVDIFYYKIIPILPPKNILSKIKIHNNLYYDRAKGLRRFLIQIIEDKEIFELKTVKNFFLDENEFNFHYDSYYGNKSSFARVYQNQVKLFSSAFGAVKNLTGFGPKSECKLEKKDSKFIKIEQEINHLKVFLIDNIENIKQLKEGFSHLKSNHNEIMSMLKEPDLFEQEDLEIEAFRESKLTQFIPDRMSQYDSNIMKLDGNGLFLFSLPTNYFKIVK